MKLFKSNIKLYYAGILTVMLQARLLCDVHGTPTSKTEPLRIVSNVQLVKGFYCEMNGKYSITLVFFDSN